MLVEREPELAALNRSLRDCRQGRRQVVVIRGTVGSGKTALMHTFADSVDDDVTRLFATGSLVEWNVPFGVLGQLFRGPLLPTPVRTSAEALLGMTPPPSAHSDLEHEHFRALDALCAALTEASRHRPLVIMIDDVHHVDDASLLALHFIERRLRFSPLTIALTELSAVVDVPHDVRAEIRRWPRIVRLSLELLSESGVTQLLAAVSESDARAGTAAVVHAATGGNPALVEAMLTDVLRERRPDTARRAGADLQGGHDPPALPANREFPQRVLACLHRVGPEAVSVARAVATLGPDATARCSGELPDLVAKLTELDLHVTRNVLDILEESGLVRDGRFRHGSAREAVLRSTPRDDLARLRMGVAAELFYEGAQQSAVAAALTGLEYVDEPWAVGALRQAASEDVLAGRLDLALQKLQVCMRSTDAAERAELTMAAVRVEWRLNPAAAARHLPALRQAHAAGLLSEESAGQLSWFLVWSGGSRGLADDLPATGSTWSLLRPGQRTEQSGRPAGGPTTYATAPGSGYAASTTALHRELLAGLSPAQLVPPAERILTMAAELQEHTFDDHLAALIALLHADRAERVTLHCDRLLAGIEVDSSPTWRAVLLAVRAESHRRSGYIALALTGARAALATLPPAGWGAFVGAPVATIVAACTVTGRHDEAATHLRNPLPDGAFDTFTGQAYLAAKGRHLLAVGQPEAALRSFLRCGDLSRDTGIELPGLVPWRAGAAQSQMLLGRTDAARRHAQEHLERTADAGPRTRGAALRVLAETLPPGERIPILDEAVRLFDEAPDRFNLANALADLSHARQAVASTNGTRSAARSAPQPSQGRRTAPVSASRSPADRPRTVRTAPTSCTGDSPALRELSAAEYRVAELAAQGHTNKEIGARLFITVSTVEQHLTRVYRKLGVSRRAHLRGHLPHVAT